MMFKNLKNMLLEELYDVDLSRPTGRCGVCGHKTYMLAGSMFEDVCIHCKIMRILIPLRVPIEVINDLIVRVENHDKLENKVKLN